MKSFADIPAGWTVTSLGRLVERISGGGTPSKSDPENFSGNIPFMTVKDMKGRFVSNTVDHISEKALNSSATTLVPADTLVVATRMSLGKIVRPLMDVAINQDLKALFLKDGIDKTYIEHFWRYSAPAIQKMGTGTTVKGIRLEDVRSLPVPVPPSGEQRRIADKLDRVLAHIDVANERLSRIEPLLKQFRQAVLFAAMSGSLTEGWRRQHNISNIWESLILSDISDIAGGLAKGSTKWSDSDELLPYLRVANVQRGYIDLSEIKYIRVPRNRVDDLLLKPGDVLFNEGGDIDKLGRGWVWNGDIDRCVFQNHVFRARITRSDVVPKYVSYWGNSMGYRYFLSAGKQTTNLASISKTVLSRLPLSLPSLPEQEEIIRIIEGLFSYVDKLERRVRVLKEGVGELTLSVLEKTFHGKLVSQDLCDEPASEFLARLVEAKASESQKPIRRKRQASV